MTRPLLEVIALDAADARAAEAGGADRLEIVADMGFDGLTPSLATVVEVRAATGLPLRVMLRGNAGFQAYPGEVEALSTAARDLAAAGADAFVLGFLTADGDLDVEATTAVSQAVPDRPWTCHRAVDHARDADAAFRRVIALPGLDTVLTAGSAAGVSEGLEALRVRAAAAGEWLLLAGGGLRPEHVAPLAEAGVRAFHVGKLVRKDGSWSAPVDAGLVRQWRDLVDAAVA